ncbi:MAG: UDP-N-acetylglucosamine 1-carboxyvinyltransferase [Coriobacteriales bacterium]|nr:UDP-N-acetylglucosamine 1-carboxyvinyltransferase [Coriobacteriales bacterium]
MPEGLIVVNGGAPLAGTVSVAGAKNSVLKLMAASLLAPGVTTIRNVPIISDVTLMGEVLENLGAKVAFGNHEVTIDTAPVDSVEAPWELVARMRASIAVLGPLVGRFGRAHVAMPGGCQIGSRKLDMHILGLEALGVAFDISHGFIDASIPQGLKGAPVILDFPSVGATENLMMAAVRACGITTIDNAAREPEIVDLAGYLVQMGARITGAGTPTIEIEGVDELLPVAEHRTIGDRIEAGTFLVAGVLGGGPLTVEGVRPAQLEMALSKLKAMGAELTVAADRITVSHDGALRPTDIQTLPHPGFPTDLQAQFMVLDALADGRSVITENVFENRFMFADEIARMGADIRIEGHFAFIDGVRQLSGAPVRSPDLRGGAALVLAGLVADGQTVVAGIEHIDRGYEHFERKLASCGARIERVPAEKVTKRHV